MQEQSKQPSPELFFRAVNAYQQPAAIKAAVEPGEFDHLTAQLPPDYEDLLGLAPVQH